MNESGKNNVKGRPGIPVDSGGNATIDPTKNVLDLVRAESKYQDAMRDAQSLLINEKVGGLAAQVRLIADSVVLYQDAQREAETKRIDQLAENRQEFQNTIRDMLAESVRTTSSLVSTQLVQIQATFDMRVTKLEAYQLTQAGRSSISDPATADTLNRLNSTISQIGSVETRISGQHMGKTDTNARLLAIVMACAAVASPVVSILVTIMVMRAR